MTELDQRISIAEFCGWKRMLPKSGVHWDVYAKDGQVASVLTNTLPDYVNNLNDMWDAEQYAGETVIKAMRFWLWKICDQMTAHHATAAQRAEAFLRATNRWTDL